MGLWDGDPAWYNRQAAQQQEPGFPQMMAQQNARQQEQYGRTANDEELRAALLDRVRQCARLFDTEEELLEAVRGAFRQGVVEEINDR